MSLQGSCFMMTREKYWELNICDEAFGSWGSQGIEVAVKTWLSGGKVMCNHKTWYAHMFRTKAQNGFGFPYPQSGKQIQSAKSKARDIFFNNKWDKAIHPLSWLIERFMPVDVITKEGKNIGWTPEALAKLKEMEAGKGTTQWYNKGQMKSPNLIETNGVVDEKLKRKLKRMSLKKFRQYIFELVMWD